MVTSHHSPDGTFLYCTVTVGGDIRAFARGGDNNNIIIDA